MEQWSCVVMLYMFILLYSNMAEVIVVMAKGIGVNSWLKCCFMSTEAIGLLVTGAQDIHLDFHTAPEL